MQSITPEQLKARLDRGETLTIFDVREEEEVAQGMIPGARHLPLSELADRYSEIASGGETILVCRSGNRSSKAYDFLEAKGVKGLKNMTGGMLAWDQL